MKRPTRTEERTRRRGFTLLELIAVIGIVAIMATLVIGGYNGMMTAMSASTAFQTLERALNLARQEACIDSADTYFFAVDVNRFAIVRKSGRVTRVETNTSPVPYGIGGADVKADQWVFDEYADLADRQQTVGLTFERDRDENILDNQANKTVRESNTYLANADYDGMFVFNITRGSYAKVKSPSNWVEGRDSWVFGVDFDSDNKNYKFRENDTYGWVSYPVFTLPDGWVFKDTYDQAGDKIIAKVREIKIHFNAYGMLVDDNGDPVTSTDLEIVKPATGQAISITVSGKGVKRKKQSGGGS